MWINEIFGNFLPLFLLFVKCYGEFTRRNFYFSQWHSNTTSIIKKLSRKISKPNKRFVQNQIGGRRFGTVCFQPTITEQCEAVFGFTFIFWFTLTVIQALFSAKLLLFPKTWNSAGEPSAAICKFSNKTAISKQSRQDIRWKSRLLNGNQSRNESRANQSNRKIYKQNHLRRQFENS